MAGEPRGLRSADLLDQADDNARGVAKVSRGELVATFALAQDNAFGEPLESQLRSCLLATWMAEQAGYEAGLKETIYWTALLRYLAAPATRTSWLRPGAARGCRDEEFDGPVEVVAGRARDHGAVEGSLGGAHGVQVPDLGRKPASYSAVLVHAGQAVKECHRGLREAIQPLPAGATWGFQVVVSRGHLRARRHVRAWTGSTARPTVVVCLDRPAAG